MAAIGTFNNLPFLNKSAEELQKEYNEISEMPFADEPLIGTQPSNMVRNRYPDVIANDATRVRLERRKDDYFNGNHCLNGQTILCQAPKCDGDGYNRHHEDFYTVLLENECSAVCMLTDYIENGREKCSHYLPLNEKIKWAGPYSITSKINQNKEFAALLELGIKVTDVFISTEKEVKKVRHFHFPLWGDGTGGTPKVIAALVRQLLIEKKPLIHCSAGIGRAGTTAATMAAYLKILDGKATKNLVPDAVKDLRKERHSCVQSLDQYATIYNTLKVLVAEDQAKNE